MRLLFPGCDAIGSTVVACWGVYGVIGCAAPVIETRKNDLVTPADAAVVFPREASAADPTVIPVQLLFRVDRRLISLDDSAQRYRDAWKHVDEHRLDSSTIAFLARNGFRVGVAQTAGLEALAAELEVPEVRREQVDHKVQGGAPLTLELGPLGSERTVFSFGRNGQLAGKSFTHAERRLLIDYEVDIEGHPRIWLRLTPELFQQSARPPWPEAESALRHEKRSEGFVYRELTVDVRLSADESLVIGPSQPDPSRHVLGTVMLTDEAAGERWGTLLCLTPQLYRTDDRKGGTR